MTEQEWAAACAARGLRYDPANETVGGVLSGVALRVSAAGDTVELAINVREDLWPKLAAFLQDFAAVTVTAATSGLCLNVPGLSAMNGERLLAFLDAAVMQSTALAGQSFDDRFESDREPAAAYWRGAAGALLGAIAGAIPWFLLRNLVGIQLGYLGVLIGVAAFFGYRYLWGAHSTRFAFVSIVVSSLLALLGACFGSAVWDVLEQLPGQDIPVFAIALRHLVSGLWREFLFGAATCAVGLLLVRRSLLTYTHESNYLRRRPRRR